MHYDPWARRKLQLLLLSHLVECCDRWCWWLGRSEPCHHECASVGVYSHSFILLVCTPEVVRIFCVGSMFGLPSTSYVTIDCKRFYDHGVAAIIILASATNFVAIIMISFWFKKKHRSFTKFQENRNFAFFIVFYDMCCYFTWFPNGFSIVFWRLFRPPNSA